MRRFFAFFLAAAFVAASAAAASVLGFPGEESASVGIYIKDLTTGDVVAEHDAMRALTPASTMKALTTASALTTLGADHTFTTAVVLHGSKNGTTWNGDLVVRGSADPTLESEYFEGNLGFCDSIIAGLKKQGIKSIAGTVRVDQYLKDAGPVPNWEVEDIAWAYGAALFGVNWRDNVYRLWPATGRTKPHVPGLKVDLRKDADGTDLLRGVASERLIVWGRNLQNKKWTVTSTMPDPAAVLAYELTERLRAAGISVAKKNLKLGAGAESKELYVHRSPRSAAVFRSLMFRSDNMMAEGYLRALAPNDTRKEAIKREKQMWKERGVDLTYASILDGSGLSRGNRLSPAQLGRMLEWMAASEYAPTYTACFPKAGMNGTMKNFMANTPMKGRLALKTGSVNAVQCYAGYLLNDEGKASHVVVIMIDAFYCPRAELRKAISAYLLRTFGMEKEMKK